MTKFMDPIHEPPMDPKEVARFTAKRRRKDRVEQLEDGFAFRASGRDGFIYYREGERLLELYWEMSGPEDYDINLSLDGLREWVLPGPEPIDPRRQKDIEGQLRSWLVTNNVRARLSEAGVAR